tara:strand:+ start:313 stop:561 length:249 start_codon:yes stop_codon:yes gene_type:complete
MSEEDEKPELDVKHERQITAAIKKLNKTMTEIRKYIPEAGYYVENGTNFNVLSGDSHDRDHNAQHENLLLELQLHHSECGGW